MTGDGKMGALVSPNHENSFFGNRSIEIDELYLVRRLNSIRYENKKIDLALGRNLYEKNNLSLNVGVSMKRNPDIKKINLGYGISGEVGFLNFGAFVYNDDVSFSLGNYKNPYSKITYSTYYGASVYKETFNVETYTCGLNLNNVALDVGIIKTKYKFYSESTQINLYSASYSYKKFLFNFARRVEHSPNLAFIDGGLKIERSKLEDFYGLQYLVNKHLVLGIAYNQFLLRELSASFTLYL